MISIPIEIPITYQFNRNKSLYKLLAFKDERLKRKIADQR